MHDVPAIQQFTMASKQTKLTVLGQRSRPCLTSGSQSQDFISQDPGLGKSNTDLVSRTPTCTAAILENKATQADQKKESILRLGSPCIVPHQVPLPIN